MGFLTDNPLANMYGPYFLLFYTALLAIFIILGRWTVLSLDQSKVHSKLPVPETPNPFEIAYLRGGGDEVARLLVVELYHRGILIDAPKGWFQKSKLKLAQDVDLSTLDATLRLVAEKFRSPRDPATLTSRSIESLFGKQLEYWAKWVQDEQLVFEPEQRKAARRFGYMLIAIFLAMGTYKFSIAISRQHHNIGFLLLIGLVGAVVLRAVVQMPRFTWRGKRYLGDLQTAYSSFRSSILPKPDIYEPANNSAVWDPLLVGSYAMPVMAMGLFGASALQSSYYATLRNQFTTASNGISGCGFSGGGGCGSSGCSGGGGGGCGGGGCGGGCGGCGG